MNNDLHEIANLFSKGRDEEAKEKFLGYYEYQLRYIAGGNEAECYCDHCESDFTADSPYDLKCPDCGK